MSGTAGTAGASGTAVAGPRVVVTYCPQCRWLLRSAWYAQELLSTFPRELGEVALRPGPSGGFTVDVVVAGRTTRVWDRATDGGFPEVTELKRRVRDLAAPGRSLGHADRGPESTEGPASPEDA